MLFDSVYLVDMGSVHSIPIKMHMSYLLLLGMNCLTTGLSTQSLESVIQELILYGPLLFITVLVHELGHCFMASKLGCNVEAIILWPLGGLSITGSTPTPGDTLKVSLAGPTMHIPMIIIWKVVLFLLMSYPVDPKNHYGYVVAAFFSMIAITAIHMNSFLLIFNLIPAYPLDGGQILASYLSMMNIDTNLAGKITSIVSLLIGAWFLGYGLNSILLSPHDDPNGYIIFLFAMFIFKSGKDLYDQSAQGNASQHALFTHQPRYMPSAISDTIV